MCRKTGARGRGLEDDLLALTKTYSSGRSSSKTMSKKRSHQTRYGKGHSSAASKSSTRSLGVSKSVSGTSRSVGK